MAVTRSDSLFTEERRTQILALVREQSRVTVTFLKTLFPVSEVTLRKDLGWLEEQGYVQRTYGGAIAIPHEETEQIFSQRQHQQREAKARIAATATAHLIHDGDTIAIDASTTALALIPQLERFQELTVITTGLSSALELAKYPHIATLIPGGSLRGTTLSLVGAWESDILTRTHITSVFLGAQGCTLTEGLTDINHEEILMKQRLIAAARHVYALIDHTKWGRVARETVCLPSDLDALVTDKSLDATTISALTAVNCTVLTA